MKGSGALNELRCIVAIEAMHFLVPCPMVERFYRVLKGSSGLRVAIQPACATIVHYESALAIGESLQVVRVPMRTTDKEVASTLVAKLLGFRTLRHPCFATLLLALAL